MLDLEDTYAIDLFGMVLSGLIALRLEQLSGNVSMTSGNETIFLGKWLKRVQKQRLFPRTIAGEINDFIALYTKKGRAADIASSFNEIYYEFKVCKLRLKDFDSSDKNRFEAAVDILRKQSWIVTLPLIHDYVVDGPYHPNNEKEMFVTEIDWQGIFTKDGYLTKPLSLYIASNPQNITDAFYSLGFILARVKSNTGTKVDYHQFKIFPNNDYNGPAAIPSQIKHT
jgi:hypothetical protein